MGELVRVEQRDGLSLITLDDGKVNALSPTMWRELNEALDQVDAAGTVSVITGRDGIFSGGFDLKVLRGAGPDADAMLEAGFRTTERILQMRHAVVAAVSGHAIAMGSFLVLSCDYRIGVDGPFRLVANEVAIGMAIPHGIAELARARLSPSHLSRVMSLAEPFEAAAAVTAGYLDEVVPADQVLLRALDKAREFAALDQGAYYASKIRVRSAQIAAIRAGYDRDAEERREFMR